MFLLFEFQRMIRFLSNTPICLIEDVAAAAVAAIVAVYLLIIIIIQLNRLVLLVILCVSDALFSDLFFGLLLVQLPLVRREISNNDPCY